MERSDSEDGFSPYLDFEWYATDADGRVAILTSAGFGPVPLVVFRSRLEYQAVRACLLGLPERPGPVDGPESCWTAAA